MEAYNERTRHHKAVWVVHLRNIFRDVGAECHRIVATTLIGFLLGAGGIQQRKYLL